MDQEPQLSEQERQYLQAIFDHLDLHGTWPTFKQVDRDLYRSGRLDAEVIAKSVGQKMFGGQYSPWSMPDQQTTLPLRVVSWCARSQHLLDLMAQAIQLAVTNEREDDDPRLTSAEIRAALHVSDDDLRKLGALLFATPSLYAGGSYGPDQTGTEWSVGIGRRIRRYADVASTEQFIAALPPLSTAPAVLAGLPGGLSRYLGINYDELGPVEIRESLVRFHSDHPDPTATAFIMMHFGATSAHDQITSAIRETLRAHGLTALRADDKAYHDDLYWNVVTYMRGCGLGIAVFERIGGDEFNPNVALEVGYMLALAKPVCFLKDQTLKDLHADLIGKLYRQFDTQHVERTITAALSKWLAEKGYGDS